MMLSLAGMGRCVASNASCSSSVVVMATSTKLLPTLQPMHAVVHTSVRTKVQIRAKLIYHGIYRTDGEMARKDEMLVAMRRMNYHPGLNVRYEKLRNDRILRANCDGRVFITTENVNVDYSQPELMAIYGDKKGLPMHKLTFNVVPNEMQAKFRLVDTV